MLSKLLPGFLAFACVSATAQQKIYFDNTQNRIEAYAENQNKLKLEVSIGEINLKKLNTPAGIFTQIIVPTFVKGLNSGNPDLPLFSKLIEIPEGSDITTEFTYTQQSVDLDDYNLFKINPTQPSTSKSIPSDEIPFYYNTSIYQENSFYGETNLKVEVLGKMRGKTIASISFNPFSYNPVTNELLVKTQMEISINFSASLQKNSTENGLSSTVFESAFKSLLNHPAPRRDQIVTYPTKLVIVSDPMFQAALQPYVSWKTKKGFNVIEAYTNDPGVGNTTTSIKAYLQNLYNNGTASDPAPSYVLFVGDIDQIPSFPGTTGSHVTDLYYCEYDGGGDYFPDVYYGRFSANNLTELQPQLDKTLEYEQYLFPDESFLDDIVLVAGVDGSFAPTHGNGQINYGTDNYFNVSQGLNTYTWLYPASSGAVEQDIINQISQGVGFANYTAHCGPDGWSDPSFSNTNVPQLNNAHEYPTMIGNCCLSNKFDEYSCFGETLLRANEKGALGYIGGSNSTLWDEDYYWGVGVGAITANPSYAATTLGAYDCLFHQNGEAEADWYITQSQIIMSGNLAVTEGGTGNIVYYWEIYHLMGDPTLMTYIGIPATMSVTHPTTVVVGSQNVSVQAEPYAYVAVSQNGVLLDAKYTGTGNAVNLNFQSAISTGNLDVVVTKQNRKPYMGIINVIAPSNTPYVILNNHNNSDAQGNNNGLVDYNEVIQLDVELKNIGDQLASNVTATLSTADAYVTITDNQDSWGNLSAGQANMITASFTYNLADNIPDQHNITFLITISDSQGNSWNGNIYTVANAPKIEILNLTIDDASGNNNGRLDPGETVNISITGRNYGHADLYNGTGLLTTGSSELSITNGTANIGSMLVGQTINSNYSLTVATGVAYGTPVSVAKQISDGNYTGNKTFNLLIGIQDEDFETGDFSQYPWNINGQYPWIITTENPYEGANCSKSAIIADDQESVLDIQLDVLQDGEISFMKKVSSEDNYDFLKFYIDGNLMGEWSGEIDWSSETFNISAGLHSVSWKYSKDYSVSTGSDAAWIDYVLFPAINSVNAITENKSLTDVEMFPNPAKTILNIKYNSSGEGQTFVKILDLQGRLIQEASIVNGVNFINIETLGTGTYILEIFNSREISTHKFIKN